MAYTDIDKSDDYFNTVLYTGNGSTKNVNGVGFQPDLVWTKHRDGAQDHNLFDAVRGVTKYIESNTTDAEATDVNRLTSFNTDGFTLGNEAVVNGNYNLYVSWNWLASNTTASNTDGSITSTVSANTTSGFSIVSWTGAGGADTVGHGLGSVPKMIITKQRSATQTWYIYNSNLGNNKVIELSNTNASYTDNTWSSTTATSSVFTVGNNNVNGSGITFIAYCFAEKKGYSKIGSYTGNGNADGTFVYTGFKPAWIMVKATSRTGRWRIWDNKINPFNVADTRLSAESSDAENTGTPNEIDLVSNGFKIRTSESQFNGSGETNIYMCFAENPFVTSTGIPTTAR